MQPLQPPDRQAPLDILRGLALYGVLIVNLLTLFRVSLFAHIAGTDQPAGRLDSYIANIVAILIEFKAFTLFAFLFGVGVAVQAGRIGGSRFLIRRFLVLLVFGIAHLYLIWNGDILALYAVCGLLLIPLLRLPLAWIAVIATLLIVSSAFRILPLQLPAAPMLQAHASEAERVYSSAGIAEIFAFRWRETNELILRLLAMTLPRTLGVMMLGMAAWRSDLLSARRQLWLPVLALSALAGVAGSFLHVDLAAQLGLAFSYAAAVLLWLPNAPFLAAGGRMALTNYLTQSIVFGFVFYGYGFGLFGKVSVAAAATAGTIFYLAQLAFSRWWLRHFHFGPFEWLWRALAYGRRPPVLLDGAFTLSNSEVRVTQALVFLVIVPLVHIGIPWYLSRWGPHWETINRLGLLLIAAGATLLLWLLITGWREVGRLPARVRLTLRPERLVQTGPYSWSRHPMYLAEGTLWAGVGLYTGSPLVMLILALGALLIGFVVVPYEERALERWFGETYRGYRSRVPALAGFRFHPPPPG